MTEAISFIIPGIPVGKGRARFARRGKFMASYTPEKTVNYEALVKMCCSEAYKGEPMEGPISLHIRAYFPIPKSMKKALLLSAESERLPVTKKSDLDNIAKSICDAMNQIAFVEDAQVSDLYCIKRYSPNPRVEVQFYALVAA